MYRLNVPRAVSGARSRSPSPSRTAGVRDPSPARSASPARSIHSQYARNAVQAPIIPRYRGDTVEPMKLSAIMDSAIPVAAPTSTHPMGSIGNPMGVPSTVTPIKAPIGAPTVATPATATPAATKGAPRSPRTKSPASAPATPITPIAPITATPIGTTSPITPTTATPMGTTSPATKSPIKSPIGAPDMGFAYNPVGSAKTRGRPRKPKSPVTTPAQPIPAHIPLNRNPVSPTPVTIPAAITTPFPIPHYTQPTAVTIPPTSTTPFPLPHYTQPTTVTIPPTSSTPFPLPHYTQPIVTPHIPTPAPTPATPTTLPVGVPMTGLPAGYTYNPTTGLPKNTPATTGIPAGGYGGYGYGRTGPESNPLWPWLTGTAIGTAIGLGIVSQQEKQKLHDSNMPIIAFVPPTEAGMGTKSVLSEEEHIEAETVVIPLMKRIFDFVFSFAGLCSTFVLLCFVEVLRAKLFGAIAGETWTYASTDDGSSSTPPTVTFADPIAISTSTGPVFIPPLDLATARVTLDRTAKTYVEQLIQYYEALAVETGRESYTERTKLLD